MFQDLFNPQNGGYSQAMDSAQAEELLKTMQVGHAYAGAAPTSLVGGGAFQLESIDGTLRSVTWDSSHLMLWPAVPQDRAYSLVEQYVRTNSYGDQGSAFIPETGSPAMNDLTADRHAQKVVFLATRRGVSLASTLVRMNFGGDIESREAQAGTLWLLEKLERALYKGLADFSANGFFSGAMSAVPAKLQNLELAGLEMQVRDGDQDYSAQIASFDSYGGSDSVIFDAEGDVIGEGTIEDMANRLVENLGNPGEIHLQPKDMSNFVKQFFPKERVNVLGIADGKAGYVVREMVTTAGSIALKPNVFLRPKQTPKRQNDRAGVPAAPASATAALAVDGDTKLKSGEKYVYLAAACNEQGESSAAAASAEITVDANTKCVKLTIAQPTSGAAPTHYAVYRTDANGGVNAIKKFIGYVARSGANTIFTDRGFKAPGASTAYMMEMSPEVLVWKQLAPLMRLNLAQVTTSKEFLLWLAGTLLVFAPRRIAILQNIGF